MSSTSGLSLIEILVSLVLLSILLLAIDATQLFALQTTKSAYYFSVAIQQLHVIAARLTMVKGQSTETQLSIWNQQNRDVLPQGYGIIKGTYPTYQAIIFWGKHSSNTCHSHIVGQSGCLQMIIKV